MANLIRIAASNYLLDSGVQWEGAPAVKVNEYLASSGDSDAEGEVKESEGMRTKKNGLPAMIPGEKTLGLVKLFLRVGIPGSVKGLFNQIDWISYLENNSVASAVGQWPLLAMIEALVAGLLNVICKMEIAWQLWP